MRIIQLSPTRLKLQARRYFNERSVMSIVGSLPISIIIWDLYTADWENDPIPDDISFYIGVFVFMLISAVIITNALFEKDVYLYLFNKDTNKVYLTTGNVFTSKETSYSLDDLREISVFEKDDSDGGPYYEVRLVLKTGKSFCLRTSYSAKHNYKFAKTINDFLKN